jgi:DNA-binding transcriptional LysR family regulator
VIKKLARDEVSFWKKENLAKELEKVLIADHNLSQSQSLLQKIKKSSERFEKHVTTSSLEVARDLALAGGGIAILPSKVATHGNRVLKRISALPTFHDEICLIYRVERKQSKTLQVLSERIRDVFRHDLPS